MSSTAAASSGVAKQQTFLGHPIGLYILFFTEMWERFSYYGMRALLILYMVNFFKWTQEDASGIYKWYTSLVYITPLLGGFLADKYLGNKWAIIIGSIMMSIGHFLMAFEAEFIFYSALVFLIVGNGFFKPNMSAQVGRLYPQNDARRDAAYTIFYMGINLGAFLSPLVCGWLAQNTKYEYHAGFAAAGIGMVLGLLVYLFGLPWVREVPQESPQRDEPVDGTTHEIPDSAHAMTEEEAKTTKSVLPTLTAIAPQLFYGAALLFVLCGLFLGYFGIINADDAVALGIGGGFGSVMAGYITSKVAAALRDRVIAIFIIGAVVVFFWTAFEQAGNVANIYADKNTNRFLTEPLPEASPFPDPAVDKAPGATTAPSESILAQVGTSLKEAFAVTSSDWLYSTKPIVLVVFIIGMIWLYTRTELADARGPTKLTFGAILAVGGLVFFVAAPTFATVKSAFNPVPTPWFQSINALGIFVLAPLFAWLWVKLPKWGIDLSIAAKVAIGVFLQAAAVGLMIFSVQQENQPASAALSALPAGVTTMSDGTVVFRDAPDLDSKDEVFENFGATDDTPKDKVVHGRRLKFSNDEGKLDSLGVLSDTDRDRILRATVSSDYLRFVHNMAKESATIKPSETTTAPAGGSSIEDAPTENKGLRFKLEKLPPDFEPRYFVGFSKKDLYWDADTREFVVKKPLADKDYKQVLLAGTDPSFRSAINEIFVTSSTFRVGSTWLFWFYILCTLGELCLSPVGLSMVSKLAPARFATMLMGMWLLTSFFGGFLAGRFGEEWGKVDPYVFFGVLGSVVLLASLLCFFFTKRITAMMHGVK